MHGWSRMGIRTGLGSEVRGARRRAVFRRFERFVLLCAVHSVLAVPAQARDNFLVVVLDDVGVDKVGVYSDDIAYGHLGEGATPAPTPTIDGLAADGVLFRNAYTNPACAPTRAATLTGRYAFRTGIGMPEMASLPVSETLLPEVLAATHLNAAFGKWHIGPNGDLSHPNTSGFDHFAGALQGAIPNYENWPKVTNGVSNGNVLTYATTENVDDAIAEITGFGEDEWFVWLAFNAPHTPFHAPTPILHTQTLSGDPDLTPVPHYIAALEALDSELSRLLLAIPSSILADTTIIVFGDNGTPRQAVETPFVANRAKGTMYEGGINVPFIVKSPHIPATEKGKESLALVQTVDIFATLAEIAGTTSLAEDSVSIVPHLLNPGLASLRQCAYAESFTPNGFGPYTEEERTAVGERYKLIWRNGVYEEFFDLDFDAFEGANLLPVTNLAPDEALAYYALGAAMESRECAMPVPEPLALASPAATLFVVLGFRFASRLRNRPTRDLR